VQAERTKKGMKKGKVRERARKKGRTRKSEEERGRRRKIKGDWAKGKESVPE
jgi:hypothetical protein